MSYLLQTSHILLELNTGYNQFQRLYKNADGERIFLDEADREAEDPNTKYYSHDEFKKIIRRTIDGEE